MPAINVQSVEIHCIHPAKKDKINYKIHYKEITVKERSNYHRSSQNEEDLQLFLLTLYTNYIYIIPQVLDSCSFVTGI